MRLLLDTHISLWAITDDPRLTATARALIADEENEVFVSLASLWEIAIKHGPGRGDMPIGASAARGYFQAAGYKLLDIRPEHIEQLETLPRHHRNPFDRLLIAQALAVPLRLLTHDPAIAAYGLNIVIPSNVESDARRQAVLF